MLVIYIPFTVVYNMKERNWVVWSESMMSVGIEGLVDVNECKVEDTMTQPLTLLFFFGPYYVLSFLQFKSSWTVILL